MPAILQTEVARGWLDPWIDPRLSRYQIEIRDVDAGFEAKVSLRDWAIDIGLSPDLPDRLSTALRFQRESDAHRAGAATTAMLYLHELGHWQYCPFDTDGHERILSGLTTGLGVKRVDAETLHALANLFSDIVLNVARIDLDEDPAIRAEFRAGWTTATKFVLEEYAARGGPSGQLVDASSAVFIGVQWALINGGDQHLDELVHSRVVCTKALQQAVSKLVDVFRNDSRLQLLDRERWYEQASAFARVLATFPLPAKNPRPMVLGGDNAFSKRAREDAGYREELVRRAIERGVAPKDIVLAPEREVARIQYEMRATEIALATDRGGEAPVTPITHAATRAIEPGEQLSLAKTKWSATRLYPHVGLRFYEHAHPITQPTPGPAPTGKVPDLLFVLDCSGSMKWSWFDRRIGEGEYDLALAAFFGIKRWLERAGIAWWIRYAAVTFSTETRSSSWRLHGELDEVIATLLAYEGGETKLDCAAVERLVARATDSIWAIVITDGEIANAGAVDRCLRDLMVRGHRLSFVQIGQPTRLCDGLRSAGADVTVLKSVADLVGLVLGKARAAWVTK